MKNLLWMISATYLTTLLMSSASASISGRSLYLILNKGLIAAEAVKAQPGELNELKRIIQTVRPVKSSAASVPSETETAARTALASLSATHGEAFTVALLKAFGLPSPQELDTQSYPRPGRARMIAGFIASLKTDEKFNEAYRNKVVQAAEKKIGRPADGETVTLYINKRKVSGPIRYHKNTFDIGIVTFPNEDLPSEYQLDLILTRKAEYLQRHFTERRTAYLKKGTDKISGTAMRAGNYVLIDGEWFEPDQAHAALKYFLRAPTAGGPKDIAPIVNPSVVQRIQEGNNPTTLSVAHALLAFTAEKKGNEPVRSMTPDAYSAFLTYWKNSQAAKNNPKVSNGLPLSNESESALYAAALKMTVAMLMEP